MSEIVFASSYDDQFPPMNVLSNNKESWVTTGLYPQSVFISLENEKKVTSVNISSLGVKKIEVETCENESAVTFVKQAEMNDIPFKEGKAQEYFLNFSNSNVKVKIIK